MRKRLGDALAVLASALSIADEGVIAVIGSVANRGRPGHYL